MGPYRSGTYATFKPNRISMGNSNGVPTPHPHQIPFECGIRIGFKPHPRPEPDSNQVGLWGVVRDRTYTGTPRRASGHSFVLLACNSSCLLLPGAHTPYTCALDMGQTIQHMPWAALASGRLYVSDEVEV
jgi:hypothetical protein